MRENVLVEKVFFFYLTKIGVNLIRMLDSQVFFHFIGSAMPIKDNKILQF